MDDKDEAFVVGQKNGFVKVGFAFPKLDIHLRVSSAAGHVVYRAAPVRENNAIVR